MGGGEYVEGWYGREVQFLSSIYHQLNVYSNVVKDAFDGGRNSAEYTSNTLSDQLKFIARLISGGLKTRVFVANIGRFDTHANQVSVSDPSAGAHPNRLREISTAIANFMVDLKKQDLDKQVAGMIYSEFGRRIRSNGSRGTDHGTAAPMFIFGSCVKGGVTGNNADLSGEISVSAGVPMQHDFRSIYGSLLIDWFGSSEGEVKALLFEDFKYISLRIKY